MKIESLPPDPVVIDGVTYLTARQLEARYNGWVRQSTLCKWRYMKKGPPFVKLGGRALYPLAELERWEANHPQLSHND